MDDEQPIKPEPTVEIQPASIEQEPLPTERVIVIERVMQVRNNTGDIVIKQETIKEGKE